MQPSVDKRASAANARSISATRESGTLSRAKLRRSMDPHRLAEERSLAYHAMVGERLLVDDAVMARARARVEQWASEGSVHPRWVEGWRRVLALAPADLVRALNERSDDANALRQVTPFAGAIDARTRWQLWRDVRQRLNAP